MKAQMVVRLVRRVQRFGRIWCWPASSDRRRALWSRALRAEIAFWERFLASDGPGRAEVNQRLDPEREIDSWVAQHLDPSVDRPRILDVGSGPLTTLGTRWAGREIELAAVDPLGDEYCLLLDRLGLRPLVRPVRGEAEHLLEVFGPGRFDLVYSCNALDHCHDPLRALREMLAVTRPGGWVLLDHWVNEGEHRGYSGLHRWNLCERDGAFWIWNPRESYDVSARFRDAAEISARTILAGPGGRSRVRVEVRARCGNAGPLLPRA